MTSPTQRRHEELVALLTEIRDRLTERVETKVAPFDPDLIARNLDAIKHEIETPPREHGECCDPGEVTAGDPDEPMGVYRRRDVEALRERAEQAESELEGWKAKYAAFRADVENARRNPETLTRLLMRLADAFDADDARTPTEGEDDGPA